MKKLIGAVVTVVVVFLAIRYVGDFVLNYRLMNHFNECHAELDVGRRINQAYGAQLDAMFKEYGDCVRRKGTFVDNYFKSALVDEIAAAMKTEHERPSGGDSND